MKRISLKSIVTLAAAGLLLLVTGLILPGASAQGAAPEHWKLSIDLPPQAAAAMENARGPFFEALRAKGVEPELAGARLTLQGQRGPEQMREALFDAPEPGLDFLGGAVRLNAHVPSDGTSVVEIKLQMRPSTGYRWEVLPDPDLQYTFTNEAGRVPLYPGRGAPAIQTIRIEPTGTGETIVQLIYRRSFEASEVPHAQLDVWMHEGSTSLEVSDPSPAAPPMSAAPEPLTAVNPIEEIPLRGTPTSYDTRTYGYVTPIKNQAACGSCWAFGTVGVMESAIAKTTGTMTDLSEQFLISCNYDGWDCDGGWTATKYHYDTLGQNQTSIGAVLEADKPYTATNGTCTGAYSHPYRASGWEFIVPTETTMPTVEEIKNAIYTYGPVTAGVCTDYNFEIYGGGIFDSPAGTPSVECGGITDHQIVLVGWGEEAGVGYWILKNSWGTGWGEDGYMRIKWDPTGTHTRVGEGTSWVTYPPPKPTGVSATDGTYSDKVQVSWNASTGATYYKVYRNTTNSTSGATTLTSSDDASPYDDTTAEAGTTYYYWVKACDANSCSPYSSSDSGYRTMAPPAAPTGVSATDGTYTDKVRVTWNASSGITGYELYRNTSNTTTGAILLYSPPSGWTYYDDTSAVVGTTYWYFMKACNGAVCSDFSAGDSGYRQGAVTVPSVPTGVSASDGTYTDKVRITWTVPSGATYHEVYRNTSNATSGAALISGSAGTPHDDHTAVPGTTYWYFVKACNAAGCSDYSSSDSGYRALPSATPVLLVDDDDNYPDVRSYYTSALAALGVNYDVWNTNISDSTEPDVATLAGYDAVVWFSGHEWGEGTAGPGSAGETALATYLDGGGCLLLSSQDYLYNKGKTAFGTNYLGVGDYTSDVYHTTMSGAGTLFEGLGPYTLGYGSVNNYNYSDYVTPTASALTSFTGNMGSAGVYRDTGTYLTAFLGFPLEALPYGHSRERAIGRFLQKCGVPVRYDTKSDFNNDAESEPIKFASSTGMVSWLDTTASTWTEVWMGSGSYQYVPRSDFDGDGKTDLTKLVDSNALWYIASSTGSWASQYMGPGTYIVVSGSDFDKDGKTDPATFNNTLNALWYLKSTTGTWQGVYMGPGTYNPVSGSDFDGDGESDPAHFSASSKVLWYLQSSTDTWQGVYLGPGTYEYIEGGDFDGDNKTDPATFSTVDYTVWYRASSTGVWTGIYLGPGTRIGAADFDGDGKTDPAVFASEVLWYVASTTGGLGSYWMGPGTYQIVN